MKKLKEPKKREYKQITKEDLDRCKLKTGDIILIHYNGPENETHPYLYVNHNETDITISNYIKYGHIADKCEYIDSIVNGTRQVEKIEYKDILDITAFKKSSKFSSLEGFVKFK